MALKELKSHLAHCPYNKKQAENSNWKQKEKALTTEIWELREACATYQDLVNEYIEYKSKCKEKDRGHDELYSFLFIVLQRFWY